MKKSTLTTLGIIIPCYNEEDILPDSLNQVRKKIDGLIHASLISDQSFAVFVNDGSKDKTWQIIQDECAQHKNIKAVGLSRNFGHQSALLAGISTFCQEADCLVTIDADLQDDLNVINQMVEEFKNGAEVIFGVRKERKTDTIFKRSSALFFYKLMKTLGVELIPNHADYRLTSRRFNLELLNFEERNLFLRGVVPTIGFNQAVVYYDRKERTAGETKYPLKKMISFALEGITSFSIRPLRIITISGLLIFLLCLILSIIALVYYFRGETVRGWVSIVLPFTLLGGLQIFFLGIIGEYIGKIYKEIKNRPRFIIETVIR